MCNQITDQSKLICEACRPLVHLVEEPSCLKCGKPVAKEEQEYCYDCLKYPRSFVHNYPVFLYDEGIRSSMSGFKFQNRREFADFYVQEAVQKYGDVLRSLNLDGIIPVPVHWKKRRQRGYNQAEILAVKLSRKLEIPCYPNYLKRVTNTLPQKDLNDKERVKNLENAFELGKRNQDLLRILLVDDIYTTGTTMEICTKVLMKNAGAQFVYGLSICIGQGV